VATAFWSSQASGRFLKENNAGFGERQTVPQTDLDAVIKIE
jgi:hypothetical protein